MKNGKKQNQKCWLLGLVGCALFGIGDWLLGYVDPTPVSDAFSVLKQGHGDGYELWKITWTLLLGALGVPFMMAGCAHMAELTKSETHKKILRGSMLPLPVGWLLIHFTVSCGIYAYAWNIQAGDPSRALRMAEEMTGMLRGTQLIAALFVGVPLLLLILFVLCGKTELPKTSLFFTPVLWMALLSAVKFFAAPTPFSNGIDTFCMNAGMMIWFSYLMIKRA